MKFIDLDQQYNRIKDKIDKAVIQAISDGKYIMGPQVAKLEQRLADYVGVKNCITCSNGTDALSICLMAWNIGEGDAVFTTDFTFFATAEVISLSKATPVFVDCCPDTFNIDPVKLEQQIIKTIKKGRLKPKAIIAVDLFGLPADYDEINKIAQKYSLKVLSDSAQGFGGIYKGRKACSLGDVATTSFFPAKPLGCYGDGGAVFTNDDSLADIMRSIRVHGKGSDKYDNIRIGLNARLDTIQAAILDCKLDIFDDELDMRNNIASEYTKKLKDYISTPVVPKGLRSAWAQYTIKLPDPSRRSEIMERLKERGIPTMIYYPKPMHQQTAFSNLEFDSEDYAVSEKICSEVLSLPMHPYLTNEEIEKITSSLLEIINS